MDISEIGEPRELAGATVVGSYTQSGTGTLAIDLTIGDNDVLHATGAGNLVKLAGALDLHSHWITPPEYGTVYTIILNDTDQLTSGYFSGLPDGTEFWLDGAKFRINYGVYMGDFNDVVLTVITPGIVTGSIWWDDNGNGIRDPEETNTPNAWVALFDPYGNMVACVSTNDGTFTFEVPPGQYILYAAQASFVPSPQDQGGDDEYDSDVNGMGYSDLFTLASGQVVDLDVGLVYFV